MGRKATVGDLIKCLEKFDKDLPIGVVGYYGEWNEFPIEFIRRKTTYEESRDMKRVEFDCVALPDVDIGETPD